jgi:hypothetical protein
VHCVGYGEIVWYMSVNVFVCNSKSVSVCSWLECDCVTCTVKRFVCHSKSVSVCRWLECDCVTCTVLCESVCVCVCVCVSGV